MENRLLKKLVDNMVLKELKGSVYVKTENIVEMFSRFCDNSEDLDEILDIITNSKRYNYITLQNGESYMFESTKQDVDDFIYCVNNVEKTLISANDPVWNKFIYYGTQSCQLKDLL